MPDHPQPSGWGSNLSEPDFITNQTGHVGINVETPGDEASDMWNRANAVRHPHRYDAEIPGGE